MSEQSLFCFCFGVTLDDARADPEAAVKTVQERVTSEGCWCTESNPSGKCCLAEQHRLADDPMVSAGASRDE